MEDKIFDKFRARLVKEGWLKAVIFGLVVGFSAVLICSAICWFTGFKAVWIVAIVFAVAVAASVPMFYFRLFRPTEKVLARRMDALGLEERVITMKELSGNNSFIAQRQRADAVSAIGRVDAKLIKIAVAVPLCIGLGVAAVLGTGMTTVAALAATNVIKSGSELLADAKEEPVKEFAVSYDVVGEGYIEGDMEQMVEIGGSTSEVLAVAEPGYVFVGWMGSYLGEDGYWYDMDIKDNNPARQDFEVKHNMNIFALFAEVDDGDGADKGVPDGASSGEGDSDGDSDVDGPVNMDPNGQGGESNLKPSGDGGDGANGQFSENNQVIDGDTYYGGDTYDSAYNDAMNSVGDNDNDRGTIGDYFDNIKD